MSFVTWDSLQKSQNTFWFGQNSWLSFKNELPHAA